MDATVRNETSIQLPDVRFSKTLANTQSLLPPLLHPGRWGSLESEGTLLAHMLVSLLPPRD